MKAGAQTMNDASRVALNVDAALYGAGMFSPTPYRSQQVPVPMEIGNIEQHRRYNYRGACHRSKKEGLDHLFVIQDTAIRLEVKVLNLVKQMVTREKSRSAKIK